MMAEAAKVDTPCLAYMKMNDDYWHLIRNLRGGSKAMREESQRYLPKEEKEGDVTYEVRKSRSFLYPGYEDGVNRLVAKPFVKPVSVSVELPKKLEKWQNNVDRQGTDLTKFSKEFMQDAIDYGLSHIFVDYPVDGVGVNIFEQNKKEVSGEVYPYWTHVKAEELIGWRSMVDSSGERRLTQIRILTSRTEPIGNWGEELVFYIREINDDGTWFLHRKAEGEDNFKQVEEGTHTFKKIPLFTYYTNRTGFMTAKPPLFHLAETNLEHWQSYSDHKNFLRFIRIGILTVAGVRKKDYDQIVIGANRMVNLGENPQANMNYVEHKGEAIGAGERDLDKLEARMKFLSLLPAMTKTGDPTATGEALEASRANTILQSWVRGAENTETNALKFQGELVNQPLEEDANVNIFNNFVIGLRSAADVEMLFKMIVAETIPIEIFLEEMVKHGILPDDLDVKAVAKQVEANMNKGDEDEVDRDDIEGDDKEDKEDPSATEDDDKTSQAGRAV
jgi:hypothetical protein